jgi:hypothetical protein
VRSSDTRTVVGLTLIVVGLAIGAIGHDHAVLIAASVVVPLLAVVTLGTAVARPRR